MIWPSSEYSIRIFRNRLIHRGSRLSWRVLAEGHDTARSQSARIATLSRLYYAVMKPGTSVSDHISSFSRFCQELEGKKDGARFSECDFGRLDYLPPARIPEAPHSRAVTDRAEHENGVSTRTERGAVGGASVLYALHLKRRR
jgi:hypothetical protein